MADSEEREVEDEGQLKVMLDSCNDLKERLRIRRALRRIRAETPVLTTETPAPQTLDDGPDSKVRRVFSMTESRSRRRSSLKAYQLSDQSDNTETDQGASRRYSLENSRVPALSLAGGGATYEAEQEEEQGPPQPLCSPETILRMTDLPTLSKMLRESRDFEERRTIRGRIRDLKTGGAQTGNTAGRAGTELSHHEPVMQQSQPVRTATDAPKTNNSGNTQLPRSTAAATPQQSAPPAAVSRRTGTVTVPPIATAAAKQEPVKSETTSEKEAAKKTENVPQPLIESNKVQGMPTSQSNTPRSEGVHNEEAKRSEKVVEKPNEAWTTKTSTETSETVEQGETEKKSKEEKKRSKHKHTDEERKHKHKHKDKDRDGEDGERKHKKHKHKERKEGEEREHKHKKKDKERDRDKDKDREARKEEKREEKRRLKRLEKEQAKAVAVAEGQKEDLERPESRESMSTVSTVSTAAQDPVEKVERETVPDRKGSETSETSDRNRKTSRESTSTTASDLQDWKSRINSLPAGIQLAPAPGMARSKDSAIFSHDDVFEEVFDFDEEDDDDSGRVEDYNEDRRTPMNEPVEEEEAAEFEPEPMAVDNVVDTIVKEKRSSVQERPQLLRREESDLNKYVENQAEEKPTDTAISPVTTGYKKSNDNVLSPPKYQHQYSFDRLARFSSETADDIMDESIQNGDPMTTISTSPIPEALETVPDSKPSADSKVAENGHDSVDTQAPRPDTESTDSATRRQNGLHPIAATDSSQPINHPRSDVAKTRSRKVEGNASLDARPSRPLQKSHSMRDLGRQAGGQAGMSSLLVPGQEPVRKTTKQKPSDIVNLDNLTKMIASAEEQDRRREIRSATRAVKNEIKTGGWAVSNGKLIGKKSGITITPQKDGAIEICHIQGRGEEQYKISLLIQETKNGADETVYELTSSITKTVYLGDGDELEETDEIVTRRRLTARGSVYMTRDSKLARTLRNIVGHEFVDEEVTTEVQEDSVSRQETKRDRVTRRTMLQSVGRSEEDPEEVREEVKEEVKEKPPRKLLPRADSFRRAAVTLDVVETPENVFTRPGQTAELSFRVNCSHAEPQISWFLDGEEVTESADISIKYQNGQVSLQIQHVTSDDQGKYKCAVKAGSAEIEVFTSLFLQDEAAEVDHSPRITGGLEDVSVKENQTVTLECRLNDAPDISVQWFKGKKLLKNEQDFQQVIKRNVAQLVIAAAYPEDEGEYCCHISNQYGKAESRCHVKVDTDDNAADLIAPVAPEFIQQLTNQTRKDQEKVVFSCEIIGEPKPTVLWYKDGTLIPNCEEFYQTYDGLTAKLTLYESFGDDTGSFKCLAENKAGKADSKANLIIMGRDESSDLPAFDRSAPGRTRVRRTASAPSKRRPEPLPTTHIGKQEPVPDIGADLQDEEAVLKPIARSPKLANIGEDETNFPLKVISPKPKGLFVHARRGPFAPIPKPDEANSKEQSLKQSGEVAKPSEAPKVTARNELEDGIVSEQAIDASISERKSLPKRKTSESEKSTLAATEIETVEKDPRTLSDISKLENEKPLKDATTSKSEAATEASSRTRRISTLRHPLVHTHLPQSRTGNVGQTFILTCAMSGSPGLSITWYKDGELLENDSEFRQTYNNRTAKLTVEKLYSDDAGTYECRGENIHGRVSSQSVVKVHGPTTARRQSAMPRLESDATMKALEKAHALAVQRQNEERKYAKELEEYNKSKETEDSKDESDEVTTEETTTESPRSTPTIRSRSRSIDVTATKSPIQSLLENKLASRISPPKLIDSSRVSPPKLLDNSRVSSPKMDSSPRASPVGLESSSRSSPQHKRHSISILPDRPVRISPPTVNKEEISTKPPLPTSNIVKEPANKPAYKFRRRSSAKDLSEIIGITQEPEPEKPKPFKQQNDSIDIEKTKNIFKDTTNKQVEPKTKDNNKNKEDLKPPKGSGLRRSSSKVGDMISIFQQGEAPVQKPITRSQSTKELKRTPSWKKDGAGGWTRGGEEGAPSQPQVENGRSAAYRNMSVDVSTISDEAQLQHMLNETEDFDERKKIRTRINDLKEKRRDEIEEARLKREQERGDSVQAKMQIAAEGKADMINRYNQISINPDSVRENESFKEDHVKDLHRQSEEQKAKRLAEMNNQGSTADRLVSTHSDNLVKLRAMEAEQAKQRKLRAFGNIAKAETQTKTETIETGDGVTQTKTTTTTQRGPGGVTTTKQQTTLSTVGGFSGFGTAYGTPAEATARQLADRLKSGGSTTAGQVTVKTESWSSKDGIVKRDEKTQSWGARPTGAKGAMAAFKQADAAANPGGAKPNFLGGGGGGRGVGVQRSPSTIKQIMLNWTQNICKEYEKVNITNFSSSWSDGLAFCALIHHFHPEAFNFDELEPKRRRHNFTLAFDTAEKYADIAPLLDVEDMVRMKNPDWKCVFTYVQSFYRKFRDHECEIHRRATPQTPETPQ